MVRRETKKLFLKLQYGSRIQIGKKVGFRKNIRFYLEDNAKMTIGDRCFFNNDCSFNVVILKGFHIGDNCVIGAGCMIAQHVPDNTIVRCIQ